MRLLWAEELERALAEAKNGEVSTFLTILSSHLTQYDQAEFAREEKRGGRGNIYRLGHLFGALENVEADVASVKDSAAPEALARLKASLGKRFNPGFPPVNKLVKQIDAFLTKGTLPRVTIQRRRRAPVAQAAESRSPRGLSGALQEAFA